MIQVTDERFDELIAEALASLKTEHVKNIKNIAILWQDDPTPDQRVQMQLRHDQTLLGLYEGVPLPQRQGTDKVLPDKITLFRGPLSWHAETEADLKEEIRHTLWHEIAHYYGLDHDRIHKLE